MCIFFSFWFYLTMEWIELNWMSNKKKNFYSSYLELKAFLRFFFFFEKNCRSTYIYSREFFCLLWIQAIEGATTSWSNKILQILRKKKLRWIKIKYSNKIQHSINYIIGQFLSQSTCGYDLWTNWSIKTFIPQYDKTRVEYEKNASMKFFAMWIINII